MTETAAFIEHQSARLFGILHAPQVSSAAPPFVFCHPFGEEKLWTQRVYVSFARRLAADGHAVFRFDYSGNGDSDGRFADSSLSSALAEVQTAIEHVRRVTGSDRVSLLGLRLGATIASLVAEARTDIHHLVLWAPIVDGARYMQEVLRSNITTQLATYKEVRRDREQLVEAMKGGETVNVDGYDMSFGLYSEVSGVELAETPKTFRGPCLIVQVSPAPGRPVPELGKLAASYADATLTFAQEDPFWKEIPRFYSQAANLFSVTTAWQEQQAAPQS
jgi:exosortase A-associated hydrolase 2